MVRILRFIFFLTAGFLLSSYDITVDEVSVALNRGDAVKVSQHFDNLVEITINEKTNSYSRTQAEMVLRDFFSNNNVTGFRIVHMVNSNDAEYCVGLLTTNRGSYRTTILLKSKGEKKRVQELRFE